PADPTNPGVNTALCSYAANAWVLGSSSQVSSAAPPNNIPTPAFVCRLSQLTNGKGTSNTVLVFERFAVCAGTTAPVPPTGSATGHYWYYASGNAGQFPYCYQYLAGTTTQGNANFA